MHSLLREQGKNADRLSLDAQIARSTLREIIAGRSDVRILTVDAMAKAFGYSGAVEFFAELKSASGSDPTHDRRDAS
ncbi:MAG TPA: helix-turn-helix transcriptional regulator [Bdellovibrionota bacterium]|nr:helix-turn-helix transcriptional regulator [Bdellovibrionota bacterium]